MLKKLKCPKCLSVNIIKSGLVKGIQRYSCKDCNYHFTILKLEKGIDNYYRVRTLQMYLEGISLRMIEKVLGIGHETARKWSKQFGKNLPRLKTSKQSLKIINKNELHDLFVEKQDVHGYGLLVTELGNKYMIIEWSRSGI